jgi:hypothetical protein
VTVKSSSRSTSAVLRIRKWIYIGRRLQKVVQQFGYLVIACLVGAAIAAILR